MACKGCGKGARKRNLQSVADENAIDFTLRVPNDYRIMGNDGKYKTISAPLVKHKPTGHGYSLDVKVGDRAVHVEEKTALAAVESTYALYQENNIDIDMITVWFNANLVWLDRANAKSRMVRKVDLLTLVDPVEPEEELYTPELWGHTAWRFLGVYLAKEKYDIDEFSKIIDIFKQLLSDELTGCEECYEHFTDALTQFPDWSTQDKARHWMHQMMNIIRVRLNKPTYTFEQAQTAHRWL